MKPISFFACALFLCSSLQAEVLEHEKKAKITKNEAEHIALKDFPGGRVTAARLETVEGKLVWSLVILAKEGPPAHAVAVDATTGHIAQSGGSKP